MRVNDGENVDEGNECEKIYECESKNEYEKIYK